MLPDRQKDIEIDRQTDRRGPGVGSDFMAVMDHDNGTLRQMSC